MPGNSPGLVHVGLLFLRLGIGIMFMLHGYPKLMEGTVRWEALGHNMTIFHITFTPVAWGFMSCFAETVGGFALAVGILVRPFSFLLFCNMIVATGVHLTSAPPMNSFNMVSHPIELGIVALALMVAGGGPYSLGHIVMPLRDKWYE